MVTRDVLEQIRGVNDLCIHKRKHYEELQKTLEEYSDFKRVATFIQKLLADIENEILDLMMRKYAVQYRLTQLTNEDAIEIIKTYYFDNVPLEYLAGDYSGGEKYVQSVFDDAMNELIEIDTRCNERIRLETIT